MPFSYRIHRLGDDILLAVADSDIVGKSFSGNGNSLFVNPEFYFEKKADARTIAKLAEEATIVNAIGKRVVALLLEKGVVKAEETVEVCGLPHAQVFAIR